MNFKVFVSVFVLLAIAERAWELTLSRQAICGQKRQAWSFWYFAVVQALIYAGAVAEAMWLRREMLWSATVAGLILFAVSLVVRLVAIRTLGKFWSLHVEIREEHRLIREGIYRHVRHPAYAAILLEMISIPLVANAWATIALALAAYWPVLLARWWREEREMIAKFGEQYARYRREVPAFVPWRAVVGGAGGQPPRPQAKGRDADGSLSAVGKDGA
jgi:protein-S-isoprenylcysteine O-methyltransferase Ste14